MDFGNRRKTLRQERQETLHKVAVGTDIDMTLLSKFERRERMPTIEQLERIARYFGIDLTRLTVELTAEKIVPPPSRAECNACPLRGAANRAS
jgi:transcriptional regulator with XRE-family HTH domain